MPDTLENDAALRRAGLESIAPEVRLPRIVDEGGQNVWLRALIGGHDCEIRLSPNDLANLIEDGFKAFRRMGRE